MTVKTGIVCGTCDRLNSKDRSTCKECGNKLSLLREEGVSGILSGLDAEVTAELQSRAASKPSSKAAQQEAEEKPMDQARHYICRSCYSPVPAGHKFCGKCGTPSDTDEIGRDPDYFGDMQAPGKAKLILIKGEGMDGISYHLNSTEHLAGRANGAILFTEDRWLSPKHANFFYEDGSLMVRDEDSVNGVFLCVRGPTEVPSGAMFLAGEQVFVVESVAPFDDSPESDGTYFFASPRRESSFRIVQILEGGGEGMVVNSRDNQVVIGRTGCDMNYPNDPYISGTHIKVEGSGGSFKLVDLGSKNGTYLRISGEQELVHGDYIFLGRQLLRVEITS